MKKIFITITFYFICLFANAQLNAVSIEDYAGYKDVITFGMGQDVIRYIEGSYYLMGSTDNKFEKI